MPVLQDRILAAILVVAAGNALVARSAAQEQPLPPCAAPAQSANPQFYDEPQFTVAGVTDASQMGGHGSDTVRRSTEALTKETVALSDEEARTGEVRSIEAKSNSEKALRAALDKTPSDAALHHQLAELEERSGESLEAVKEYEKAAALNPNEINLFDWGAELLLHRAYEPAVEVFGKGRRLFPGSVRMAVGLGVATYALGSNELAAQRLCEASDLDPADVRPYMFLGKLQAVDSARIPGVAERLARFARLQPENVWANYYYAVALWKARDAQKGAAERVKGLLERALRVDPRFGLGYLQLGIVYAEAKSYSRAIEEFKKSVEVDPELEEAHFRLANAYRMSGEVGKAKAELEKYERIAKQNNAVAESDRREIVQFVYSSREPTTVPGESSGVK